MAVVGGTVLLSAGGTGGHLFPAEALAHELIARGWSVHLATDARAEKYAGRFPGPMHVIRSDTPSGKNPLRLIGAGLSLFAGMRQSRRLDMDLPMMLPGLRVKTSDARPHPIPDMRIQQFDGTSWKVMPS